MGDSIATAWENHKPRAGGEKAGEKPKRGTKQGEGTRKDGELQERGGRGSVAVGGKQIKDRDEVNKGRALGEKDGVKRNKKR